MVLGEGRLISTPRATGLHCETPGLPFLQPQDRPQGELAAYEAGSEIQRDVFSTAGSVGVV